MLSVTSVEESSYDKEDGAQPQGHYARDRKSGLIIGEAVHQHRKPDEEEARPRDNRQHWMALGAFVFFQAHQLVLKVLGPDPVVFDGHMVLGMSLRIDRRWSGMVVYNGYLLRVDFGGSKCDKRGDRCHASVREQSRGSAIVHRVHHSTKEGS